MNWTLALPEIVLSCSGLFILLFGVLQKRSEPSFACTMLTLVAFLVTGILVVVAPDGAGYHGQFVNDGFSRFMKILSLGAAGLAAILSLDYNRQEKTARFEFPVLLLFSTLGTLVMASSANLMTLYVGLELQSLAIYILCAFARDELTSAEAGLKYFVLGSLASGLLLYGISLVYGFAGTMEYAGLRQVLTGGAPLAAGLVIGLVFVIVGLAFKLSMAPFHMWTPDVYQGSPTSVTAFLAGAPKAAAFALLLRVLAQPFGHLAGQWQLLIEIVAIATMFLGSLAAIGQRDIKRLMAYSSIGHMGYAAMGIASATDAGIRGTLVYLATYLIMNAGTFGCILAMRRRGRALTRIEDLAGLGRTDPTLAVLMAVFMFSMAGVPPLAGFFGKLMVFAAAVQAGLWVLAAVGVVTSVIGLFYYWRIVKVMFLDAPVAGAFDHRAPSLSFVSAVTGVATVLFLLVLGPVTGAAQAAAAALFG
ncbi:NADH-quinone oxidoreductase subunit NuoN [Rhizosaccharibacter radicis]|uniref:NADH-quinone oxidoreductase subunit N n=1 Tax=Rhizosaccharibacter radicis TaxID=2782605 RepID=A0ABT1VYI2_9PROT|nr:NADH-quinone oxidoreductase subunit NuoN [Acetobacteraceae bacterium KSS12]